MAGRSGTAGAAPRPRTRGRRILNAAAARISGIPPGHHDYTLTSDVPVRMRDGVELLTDIYAPVAGYRGVVLVRSPYGRRTVVAHFTARCYATHGYHVVHQSCRGTDGSGGTFEPFRPDVEDGADTVAWLREQPWFGGRFAVCGPSYLGYTAWALLTDPPPELTTAVIAVAAHDNHWVTHGGGAFALEGTLSVLNGFGNLGVDAFRGVVRYVTAGRRLRPGFTELPLVRAQETVLAGSRMPYREWLLAIDVEDPVWRPLRHEQALERVDVPVLLQDGWQDAFPEQMIHQYQRLRRRGVDVALTIGPWTHVEFGTKGLGITMAETLDWLAEHLDGTASRRRPSPVRIFVSGAEEWRDLPEWPPPADERVLFLQPEGGLAETRPPSTAGPSTFTYDPARPTPAVGGRVINPTIGGYRDNRELEARDDVLTFTGPPLSRPVEVIGSPAVELAHGTDNPYADLFVRLCEVRPDGRSTNLSDGFQRLGPETASGVVRLQLEAMAHRFTPGTRIRLQVSGGAHPRYARNLGTDEDPATGTSLAPSRRTIGHGVGGFSRILLPSPTPGDGGAGPDADRP